MAREDVVEATATEVEVADPEAALLPAVPAGDIDGLDDLDESDITIPRITIDHKLGVFRDSQTNETFENLDCIMLGLVKQRVLWPPTPGEEGEGPLCRAVDFVTGYPDPPKWVEKHNGVTALTQSGFTFAEVEEGKLSCANCGLKEWESNPNNGTPWCNEQFTFPIVRITEDGDWVPALISFQRTGLKACKAYLSGFKTSKRPLYTAITKIGAVHQRKGNVEYVTPSFTKVGESDPTEWPNFSKSLANIRSFITTPRTFEDTATEEAATTTPAASATPAAAPAAPVDDEDEPF